MLADSPTLWPHTAAIFCGGKSSRMGRPKASVILPNGISSIEHIYNVLARLCKEVVLVGHGEGVPDSLGHLKRIQDNYHGLGPMGGLEALLSSGLDSEYLIAPCDLSKAIPEMFSLLIEAKAELPVVLSCRKRPEPLLGRYPASLLPLVREYIIQGKLAVSDLLSGIPTISIAVPRKYFFALSNMNFPGDVARLYNLTKKGNICQKYFK